MTRESRKDSEQLELRLPYPFETLRRCYVTRFGGVSPELRADQVGIHRQALTSNTDLVPFADRVSIGILGRGRPRPYFLEQLYEVAALDHTTPDAVQMSPLGEAVLSDRMDLERKPFDSLRKGELIVLSGVLTRPWDERQEWRWELLAKALRELRVCDS